MYRIDNATVDASLDAPTADGPNPGGFFTDGNPGGGVAATIVDAEWLNAIQEEIANVIEDADAGNTPLSKASRVQLKTAIAAMIAAAASADGLTQGLHTLFIPAAAMQPTVSNGCASLARAETTAGRPDKQVLDFDATSAEFAQFCVAFPKSWNLGTVTFRAFWTTEGAVTTGVAVTLQGVAVSNDDTMDVAYGSAITVTDVALNAAEDMHVTATSGAVTIAGTPADADMTFFRFGRDPSNGSDDMTQDLRLVGIQLFYTLDKANDA
jgi:hypothetical protein